MMRLAWVGLSAVCTLLAGAAQAQKSTTFDGNWSVILDCEPAREAAGYHFEFPAVVRGGLLHGEYGKRGDASSLELDGEIKPDGTASIFAHGLTGSPKYNVDRYAEGVPYHYTLLSRFEPTQGSGRRVEVRPCTASFHRR